MSKPRTTPSKVVQMYRLDGKQTVACTMAEWSKFFDAGPHILAEHEENGILVRTQFLGLGSSFEPASRIFETTVYGGPLHLQSWNYDTFAAAMKGHRDTIKRIAGMLP